MLPRQIHVADDEVCREKFALRNDGLKVTKPWCGGLWTSALCNTYGSDWVRYMSNNCYSHKYDDNIHVYEIVPKPEANILVLEDVEDVRKLHDEYGSNGDWYSPYAGFDWNRIAENYDAVYLAAWELLDGWDCASACWFNWNAFDVRELSQDEIAEKVIEHVHKVLYYDYEDDWDC